MAVYYQGECLARVGPPAQTPVLRVQESAQRGGLGQGKRLTREEPVQAEAVTEAELGEKWAGKKAVHFSPKPPKPAVNHPWRIAGRQAMVTKSLNN